jgi:hypothetical protein
MASDILLTDEEELRVSAETRLWSRVGGAPQAALLRSATRMDGILANYAVGLQETLKQARRWDALAASPDAGEGDKEEARREAQASWAKHADITACRREAALHALPLHRALAIVQDREAARTPEGSPTSPTSSTSTSTSTSLSAGATGPAAAAVSRAVDAGALPADCPQAAGAAGAAAAVVELLPEGVLSEGLGELAAGGRQRVSEVACWLPRARLVVPGRPCLAWTSPPC